jgi:hypothetical protein
MAVALLGSWLGRGLTLTGFIIAFVAGIAAATVAVGKAVFGTSDDSPGENQDRSFAVGCAGWLAITVLVTWLVCRAFVSANLFASLSG